MERRKAMAYAATSALILSSGLVAGAAVGGFNVLGFGGQFSSVIAGAEETTPTTAATSSEQASTPPPIYVTKYSIVDDYVVVTTASPTTAAPLVAAAAEPAAQTTTAMTQASSSSDAGFPSFDIAPLDDDSAPPPTTNAPRWSTSTTAGTPIPPKPANCDDANLEDDGWHCDDD
ncbi:MAG: hypothetical protein ABJD24_00535 [Acidimicrobiales bacterium]